MNHTISEQRIVVKVGTSTLTAGKKELYMPAIVELARQIAILIETGKEVFWSAPVQLQPGVR